MAKKNILISNVPIPSNTIGSWNMMFTNLLKKDKTIFDYVISPKPDFFIDDVNNLLVHKQSLLNIFLSKFNKNYKHIQYWRHLKKILKSNDLLIIHIIDNTGVLLAIKEFSRKCGLRNNLKIIFHLHGFKFDYDLKKKIKIYSCIDKLILLTYESYLTQLKENHALPFEVDILRNGIDSKKFHPITTNEKIKLKKSLGLKTNIKYFLWVSQDRPKKGLSIILSAWEELVKRHDNIHLLIIGNKHKVKGENLTYFGRLKNTDLIKFYQSTDFYLFSSLCHEGHPLSLTEAIKCGVKCLVSDIDPIAEILNNEKYGILVKHPNFVKSWIETIEKILSNEIVFNKYDANEVYRMDEWISNIKRLSS